MLGVSAVTPPREPSDASSEWAKAAAVLLGAEPLSPVVGVHCDIGGRDDCRHCEGA